MRKLRKVIPFGLAIMMSVSGVYPSTGVFAAQQQISTNSKIKKESDTSDKEDATINRYLSPKKGFNTPKKSVSKQNTLKTTTTDSDAKEGEIGYKFTQEQTINDTQKIRYEYTIIADGEVELDCVSRVTVDKLTFPSTVSLDDVTYKVTSASLGFELGSHVKHLIVPEGVESVYKGGYMTNEIVTLPSTLKEIKGSFYYDDSNWFNGSNSWKEQQSLKRFELSNPENAKYFTVQDGILYNKDQTKLALPVPPQLEMDELTLPDTLQEIPDAAFQFTKIKKVICGKNITSIGEGAFAGSDIENIEMNDKITSIEQFAFEACKKLRHMELSAGLTKLSGWCTFSYTESLKHIDLKNIKTLNGTGTFLGSALEDIDISNVSDLTGEQPFVACDNLKSVYIGKNTDFTGDAGLGVNPFCGCDALEKYVEKEKNEHHLYVEDGKLYASQMVGSMRNLDNVGYDDKYVTKLYHGKILVGYPFVQMVDDAKKNNGCLKIPEDVTQLAKGANLEGSQKRGSSGTDGDVNNIDVYFTKLIIPASVEAIDLIMTSPGANLEIDFYGDTFPLSDEGLCTEYMANASKEDAVLGTKTFKFKSKELCDKFNNKWKSDFLGLYKNEKVVCDVLPEKKTTSLVINRKDEVLKCVKKSYKMKVLATLSSDDCTDFVKLKSSNEEVATVDAYRNISTKIGAHGTSTITVTAGEYSQNFDVTVAGDMEVDSTATEDKTYVYDKDEYDSDEKFLKTIKDDISASCKDCGAKLTEGKDYEITISDYKKTGKATVTVKGIGGFDGFEDSFKVNVNYMPKKIKVKGYYTYEELEENSSFGAYKWTGKEVKPNLDHMIRVENSSGFDLTEGIDYKIEYSDDMISDGEKTVKVIGLGDYEGTEHSYHYTIEKQHGWNGFTVKGHKDGDDLGKFDWTGNDVEPKFEVTCNHCGDTLANGTDYYLEYSNNHRNPGKVTVKVIGINDYDGWTQSFTYMIKNKTFTFADHENGSDLGELEYNGEDVKYPIYAWEIIDRNNNRLTENVDYKITYSDNDKPGKATMNIVGLGSYEGCNLSFTYTLVDYDGESGFYGGSYADQSNIGSFYYTGKEIKPEISVYSRYSRTLLTEGKDYKIEYKDNIKRGTASMKVIGINRFVGHELNFTYTIKNKTFTFADHENGSNLGKLEYDGKAVKYPIDSEEIRDQNDNKLTENVDYKVTYSNNDKPGKATMNIIGLGDYEGCELNFTYTIDHAYFMYNGYGVNNDGADLGTVAYTGKATEYEISDVYDSNDWNNKLTEGKDYKLVYSDNTKPGTAKVEIIGSGIYTGCDLTFTYTIVDQDAMSGFSSNLYMDGSDIGSFAYTGEEVKPSLGLIYGNQSQSILVEGVDYKIEYSNNVNPGTATAKVIGIGRFAGKELTFTYTIKNKSFASKDHKDGENLGTLKWTGKEQKMDVGSFYDATDGHTLVEGKDYKLVYADNKDVGTAKVKVIGLGYYDGSELSFTYTIEKQHGWNGFYSKGHKDGKSLGTYKWTGSSILIDPDMRCSHCDKELEENKDYKVEYTNNIDPGTATMKITGLGDYKGYELTFTFVIEKKAPTTTEDQKPTTTETKPTTGTTASTTTTTTESKPTTEDKTTATTESKPTTSSTTTEIRSSTEDSSTLGTTTTEKETATTAAPVIRISIKKAAIQKIKALKKAFTINILKNKDQVTGYQISYSYKKNFKGQKVKTLKKFKYKKIRVKRKKYTITSYKVKGLKKKKTVYVRVRAYKQVGKMKVYGKWSSVKKVKIK